MSSPTKMGDEFGSYAHGVKYIDFCRYCREYESSWDSVRTNKEWSLFAKGSY